MLLKQNQNSLLSVFCFLFALLFLGPATPSRAVDNVDPLSSGTSARERFYNKYKDRVPSPNSDVIREDRAPSTQSRPSMDERRKQIELKREKMRKARAQQREQRRKKITLGNDRLEGKAADVSKKEKERLDARRKEMQQKKAARREERLKKIEERRQAMREKTKKLRQDMRNKPHLDVGGTGYDDPVSSGKKLQDGDKQRTPSGIDRMEELKKRREAMKEKSRKLREAMREKRKSYRGNPDAGYDRPPASKPHVSGSTSPKIDDTIRQTEPHISGATSDGDRPHISGAR